MLNTNKPTARHYFLGITPCGKKVFGWAFRIIKRSLQIRTHYGWQNVLKAFPKAIL